MTIIKLTLESSADPAAVVSAWGSAEVSGSAVDVQCTDAAM